MVTSYYADLRADEMKQNTLIACKTGAKLYSRQGTQRKAKMSMQSKLECFHVLRLFRVVRYFRVKKGAYSRVEPHYS